LPGGNSLHRSLIAPISLNTEMSTLTTDKDCSGGSELSKIGHRPPLRERILPFLVFAVLWCMLIAHLSQHWISNPQYNFGGLVPVICVYLFGMRWRTRPPAQLAHSVIARWVFWGAGFCLLPTWLIAQANPDWRLIGWLLAIEIVALSLCSIYTLGGKSWLEHFAFSICFIFLSVPWPDAVESFVIQGLTQAAAAVTVANLNLFHIVAIQHGNIIEVRTGMLGIDEACSGIRSLQTTIVASLFLGELYRASRLRRLVLVILGALIAFLCNVGRTFVLGAVAASNGLESISTWHDPLGLIILVICVLSVWGFARLISGSPRTLSYSKPTPAMAFPRRWALVLGGWLLLTIVGTEFWYRKQETGGNPQWSVTWPVDKMDFSDINLSESETAALECDQVRAAEWKNGDGSHWTGYFFRWAEGPIRSRILARMHRPENCLPAAGYRLREDRGTIMVEAKKNLFIPFRALDFEDGGYAVYVFFCLWENRSKQPDHPRVQDKWTHLARLESVLLGDRNLGQQVLEIVLTGYDKPEEAEAALRKELPAMVQS
jgi:exosortase